MSGAVELATAYIALVPSLKGASQKISAELNPAASAAGASAGDGLGRSILGTAAKWAGPLAAAVGFGAVIKSGFDEAKDAAAGTAQLAAGIQSTGNAAHVSVQGLNDLASSIQGYSGQTDDSIVKSEQLLLTFTNIKNSGPDKIFDLATKASADMAAKFGGDASQQAVLLGKALNDPVKGISALQRVGVSFTASQKDAIAAMIKTGDVAGAQKIILKELNTEFGGAAKAAGASFPGQLQRVHRAFEDLAQGVVQGFLPVMGPALEGVIKILQKLGPAAAEGAQKVADVTARVGGAVVSGFQAMRAAFSGEGVTSDGFIGAMEHIGVAVRGVVDKVGPVLSSAFAVIGPVFQQIMAAVGPLIPQFVSLWSSISPIQTIFQAIEPLLPQLLSVFGQLASVIGGALGTALTTLLPVFTQLQGVFVSVFSQVLATVLPVIVQLVTMLGDTFSQLIPIVVPIITQIATLAMTLVSQLAPILMDLISAVMPMVVTIFGAVVQAIGPLIQMIAGLLIPIIQALMPVVVTVFGVVADIIKAVMQVVMGIIQVVTGIISGNWSQVWTGIQNIFAGIWNTIKAVVMGAINIVGSVISNGLNLVWGVVSGILGSIGQFFIDTWNNITNGVAGFINGFLRFFTDLPSKVMSALSGAGTWLLDVGRNIVQGLIDGVGSMINGAVDAVKNVGGAMLDGVKNFLGIKSPSRRFKAEVGMMVGAGVIEGVESTKAGVASSVNSLVPIPKVPGISASITKATLAVASAAAPIYVQNPFTGQYLLAQVDGRVSAGMGAAARGSSYQRGGAW